MRETATHEGAEEEMSNMEIPRKKSRSQAEMNVENPKQPVHPGIQNPRRTADPGCEPSLSHGTGPLAERVGR